MAIRLLALDLDGTLLNSRGQISDRNRKAIDSARENGVKVALVTGRRFRDSRPIALELGLDVPVIAHNGALTKHARTLETVVVTPLPLAAAHNALRIGREVGADALVSDDHQGLGVLVYDHLSGDNAALQEYVAWARRVHGDEDGQDAVREVVSLEDYLDHEPIHLAFSGGCVPARRGGTCQGDTANGTRSTGGSGAEVTPGSGRLFQSHSPRSWLTAATTASTAPRSAPMFRRRAGKGGLVDELLAARGAGSPVSFTAWLKPEDGLQHST